MSRTLNGIIGVSLTVNDVANFSLRELLKRRVGHAFVMIPLFIKEPPIGERCSFLYYHEILSFTSITSEFDLPLDEWSSVIVSIPIWVLSYPDLCNSIVVFLKYLNIAAIYFEGFMEANFTLLQRAICVLRTPVIYANLKSHETFWRFRAYPLTKLCVSFNRLKLMNEEEREIWLSCPLGFIHVEASSYMTTYEDDLLMKSLIEKKIPLCIEHNNFEKFTDHLERLCREIPEPTLMKQSCLAFEDVLQIPLQPLAYDLSPQIYQVFEEDAIKYSKYAEALSIITSRIRGNPRVLVIGAGRGPLVSCALLVCNPLEITAVEINLNAFVTLVQRNKTEWKGRVQLVQGDIRYARLKQKYDIIISEFLGSFGDNELAPECLAHITEYLKEGGYIVPKISTSYLQPVMYPKYYHSVARNPQKGQFTESPSIVFTRSAIPLSPALPIFQFDYGNPQRTMGRSITETFKIFRDGVINGFMGYFKAILFEDAESKIEISLSIHPDYATSDMLSWFPIFFPLTDIKEVSKGDKVSLCFQRHAAKDTVWYEWKLSEGQRFNNPGGKFFSLYTYRPKESNK